MNENLIHTPEGVRDIYGAECQKKRYVMRQLRQVMNLYHYDEIETPTFEYFDIFNQEKGTAHSREMYKFIDRENNTLVLRPDMTPSIARCVAKYFADEKQHIRLWYQGQAFKNQSRLHGKLNEFTQLGAELFGDDTSAADGEMLSMVIDCFLAVGLKEFQVSIGQVEYFRGLVEEAGLDQHTADELRLAIQNKNSFAIDKICKQKHMSSSLASAFANLTNVYGGVEVLETARDAVSNERSLKAVERLLKLYKIIEYYDYQSYVSFDLGLLSNYNYYSGVIFKGYTYGSGSPVVAGGRYNGLVNQFGVDTPSVGFAFFVDELMAALLHQKIVVDTTKRASMVLYMNHCQKTAISFAKKCRLRGETIQLTRKSSRSTISEYVEHCREHGIQQIFYFANDDGQAEVICVADGAKQTQAVDEIGGAQ